MPALLGKALHVQVAPKGGAVKGGTAQSLVRVRMVLHKIETSANVFLRLRNSLFHKLATGCCILNDLERTLAVPAIMAVPAMGMTAFSRKWR